METKSINPLVALYIEQMSAQEKLVLQIATEHLESSFDIEKSIGFKEWCDKRKV
tara:strand:+ start:1172 stop:1333 length:162 start_codon:yes stop_codon:yes gene_type:complete